MPDLPFYEDLDAENATSSRKSCGLGVVRHPKLPVTSAQWSAFGIYCWPPPTRQVARQQSLRQRWRVMQLASTDGEHSQKSFQTGLVRGSCNLRLRSGRGDLKAVRICFAGAHDGSSQSSSRSPPPEKSLGISEVSQAKRRCAVPAETRTPAESRNGLMIAFPLTAFSECAETGRAVPEPRGRPPEVQPRRID